MKNDKSEGKRRYDCEERGGKRRGLGGEGRGGIGGRRRRRGDWERSGELLVW